VVRFPATAKQSSPFGSLRTGESSRHHGITDCPKTTDRSALHMYEYELETHTFVFRYLTAGDRYFCSKILLKGNFQKTDNDLKNLPAVY